MDYSDLKKLKAYFLALKESNYHPKLIPNSPGINKPRCLELLRSFPDLKGKNDNQIFEALSDPKRVKSILDQLPTSSQRNELRQVLEDKPVTTDVPGQPISQEASPPPPTGESAGTMAGAPGGKIPSMPQLGHSSGTAGLFRKSPIPGNIPEEGMGTAATNKINQLRPATAKMERLQSATPNPGTKYSSGLSSNFRTFGSNAGISFRKYSGKIAGGLGQIAGGVGRNVLGPGLSSVYNQGARAVLGARRRVASVKGGIPKPSGVSGARIFGVGLIILFLFMLILGTVIGNSTPSTNPSTSTGNNTPTTNADFTSFDIFKSNSVDDALLKKYIDRAISTGKIKTDEQKNLLSSRARFIRDQAQAAGLNPAIFLGYWESESAFSDYTNPGVRPGMDLGCDPTNRTLTTFEDDVLCAVGKSQISNSRTSQCALSRNISSAACQAILFQQGEGVKLPIATLKDFLDSYGSKVSDPNNTRSDAIVKQTITDLGLVSAITTPSGPVDPLVNNDYIGWIKNNFNVILDPSFGEEKIRWAYNILNVSIQVAPDFKKLISSKGPIEIVSGGAVSSRSPGKINLSDSSIATEEFFKVTLIHELGHSLKGDRTENTLPISNAIARDKDFLTGYAQGSTQGSTAGNEVCVGIDSHEVLIQADEDFAESVTYYINSNIVELDFDKQHLCLPKTKDNPKNPYLVPSTNNASTPKYLNHCQLMQSLLGGQNCPLSF